MLQGELVLPPSDFISIALLSLNAKSSPLLNWYKFFSFIRETNKVAALIYLSLQIFSYFL